MIVSVTLWTGIKILKAKALVNIGINGYTFINPRFTSVVYDAFKIETIPLLRPKSFKAFNDRQVASIIYKFLPGIEVAGHRESNAFLFIADIGRYDIILGLPWIKQHRVRLDPGA